jgi:hypothetical protein
MPDCKHALRRRDVVMPALESMAPPNDNHPMATGQFNGAGTADLARYRVQRHFTDHRALAPGDAIEYAPKSPAERRAFDKLRAAGVIRETHPAHYWFDLDRMGRERPPRDFKRYVGIALGLVAVALAWMLVKS